MRREDNLHSPVGSWAAEWCLVPSELLWENRNGYWHNQHSVKLLTQIAKFKQGNVNYVCQGKIPDVKGAAIHGDLARVNLLGQELHLFKGNVGTLKF